MLDALRSHASSWIVKILLLLLVISFVAWGIGDVFTGSTSSDVVAKVDGLPVSAATIEHEAQARMSELQQQTGGKLPASPAIMNSLRQQALSSAIARRLLDAHAAEIGLVVPDEVVVRTIRDEPSFQGNGGFDRRRFETYLQQMGMREPDFVEQLRGDILRGDIVGALTAGARGTGTAAGILAAYQNEQRSGRALIVPNSAMHVATPDDAALKTYLEANKNRYQAPEYRKVQIVVVDSASLAQEQQVSETDAKADYDTNKAKFTTPERRTADQLLATDKAALEEAAAKVAAGADMTAVAAELKDKGVTYSRLGPVAKGQLPEALETAIWAMQPGATGTPIQDPFGWHLVKLLKVAPETVTPFDQVKAQIEKDLALQKVSAQLPDITNQLDDALGGNASLADAAARVGLKTETIAAVDRNGMTPEGAAVASPRLSKRMLDEIFATGEGQTSLLITDDDGRYFVVAVDTIQPPRTKTIDEARADLVANWQATAQTEAAQKLAGELLAKVKAGQSLEALAAATPGTRIEAIPSTVRMPDKDAAPVSPAAPSLFEADRGKPVDHAVALPDGSAVVVVDDIKPADPKVDLKPIQDGQTAGFANDLVQDYESALRQRFSIKTYPEAIAALTQRSEP